MNKVYTKEKTITVAEFERVFKIHVDKFGITLPIWAMLPIWAIRPDCLGWSSDRWLEAPVASWRKRDSVATVQVAIKY